MKNRIKFLSVIFVLFIFSPLAAQSMFESEKLDELWDFYLRKTPEQDLNGVEPDCKLSVPGFWTANEEVFKPEDNQHTYGCYRYKKTGLIPGRKYAILIKDQPPTSSAVYVNGTQVFKSGNPFGMTLRTPMLEGNSVSKPVYCEFYSDDEGQIDLIIFITNYFYRKGGLWDSVLFGPNESILRINIILLTFYTLTAGILLFIGLINLIQFIMNKKTKEYMYLGITAIACALRIVTAGYCSLCIAVPNLPAEIKYKLEYVVMWAVPIAAVQIITILYPLEKDYLGFKFLKEKTVRGTWIILGLIAGLISLIIPAYYSNRLVPVFQYYIIITAIYIIGMVIYSHIKRRKYIGYYSLSFLILILGAIVDIVYTQIRSVIPLSFFPFFLVVFIFVQILLITRIQNDVYKNTVKISNDLQVLNKAYLRFVPKEFLNLLNKDSITKIGLGDHSTIEMAIVFAKFKIECQDDDILPEEHFELFNKCLSEISPIITNHGGFVSKFLSGGVMALFPSDETEAMLAAMEINDCIKALSFSLEGHSITSSIGVHYGKMIIGTIGEENRLDDTVISDTVNTAARIESVCERLNKNLILSHSIHEKINFDRLRDVEMENLEAISVKGKQKPLQLYACKGRGV